AARPARSRAARLGAALALAALAALANPAGLSAFGYYFTAGAETPTLELVADEWRPITPWELPRPTLPPSLLAWTLASTLPLGVAWVLRRAISRRNPAIVAVTAYCVTLQFTAVRFLWLGLFPLLLLANAWPTEDARVRLSDGTRRTTSAFAAALLLVAFIWVGDWPMISGGLPTTWAGYQRSYAANKYFADSIWWIRDAGLRGNLYTDYLVGGFAGYWLAPDVRTLLNGSLNFSNDTARAMRAIGERRGVLPGESFPALLDRLGIDLFLGIRPPEVGPPIRPWASTTAHLEHTPGWIPVFRNVSSAIYLRSNERNRANLARVARYYEQQGLPFDPRRGFDLALAIPR
ncbi:MAG: hypothetical protein ACREI7_13020, partial [Myxococcota bacterium]